MERHPNPSPLSALLENLRNRFLAHKAPRDPDPEQIFSDSIERAMIYRELHCR
jgi:hypothetical protein